MSTYRGGVSPSAEIGERIMGLKQLVGEDGGQWSSLRSYGYLLVGLIVADVIVLGRELGLWHIILAGLLLVAKVAQKVLGEKPAQGVVDAREAQKMIDETAARIVQQVRGGGSTPIG